MKKLTLLVDMDDVLECLVDAWCKELNRRHGTSVVTEDIDDWAIAKFFPTLTKEQLFAPLNEASFWQTLSPMQNAQEVLCRLKNDGHTIRVVTASHFNTVSPKVAWLLEHYPYLKWEDVIIASDKSIINGDVMIDDGTHNLEVSSCMKILFDRPHNRKYDADSSGMVRVHNWDEIYDLISHIAGGTYD